MRVPRLQLFGEGALFAEGNDVVVNSQEVAVGDDGDSERGTLPVLEMRLVAELLTVLKRVMACWICMVFLLLPGHSGHIPKGAEVAAPKSRHRRIAKMRSFWKGHGACERGGVLNPEGAVREF